MNDTDETCHFGSYDNDFFQLNLFTPRYMYIHTRKLISIFIYNKKQRLNCNCNLKVSKAGKYFQHWQNFVFITKYFVRI